MGYSGTGATITGTTNSVTVSYSASATSGNLSVTATNGCGTSIARTIAITVNPLPSQPADFTTSTSTVCQGTSNVAYTVPNDPTVSYTWSYSGTGATITGTGNSVTVSYSASATSGNLSVTATNGCGTSIARTIAITVNPLPTQPAAFTTSTSTVCQGASNVAYTVPNDATVTYTWVYSGTGATITGTTNSVTISYSTSATSGNLSVTATNGCGTSIARTIGITVNPLPTISVTTSPACSADLKTYSLTVTVSSGIVTSTFGIVTNEGSNVWSITDVPSGINITVTVTDGNGCANTLAVTAPNCTCPIVLAPISGGDKSYCEGGVIPTISAIVLTGETVDWYSSASGGTLLKSGSLSYTPSASGTYYAVARNTITECISSTRTPVTLTMNPLPTPTLTSSDGDNVFCSGTSVTFTAGGGTEYNFRVAGTSIQIGTSSIYTTSALTNNQVVDVIVANANGCIATSAGIINTVNPLMPVSVSVTPSANPVCAGTSVTLTAIPVNGGTTPAYQWKVNGTNAGTNNPVYTYTPLNGDIVTCVLTSNATCATGSPATSNAINMTVNPLLPVSVSVSPSANNVCAGTSVTFTATPANGGTTPVYQWKVNGVNAGTNNPVYTYTPLNGDIVTCVLTSNATCATGSPATSNAINMTVNPLLPVSVSVSPSANNVCAGTSVTFTATPVNGGTTPVYQWKVNGANAGSNNPVYNYTPADGDVVTCVLTSNATCVTGSPATSGAVNMSVIPTVGIPGTPVPSAATICQGTSSTTFTTSASNATSYNWTVTGSGNFISGTSTTGTVTWAAGFSGEATISVTANGCSGPSASASTTAMVRPTPTATISGTTTVCQNTPVPNITFTNPQVLPVTITYNINGGSNTTINVGASASATLAVPTTSSGTFAYNLVSVIYQSGPTLLKYYFRNSNGNCKCCTNTHTQQFGC